MKKVCIVCGGQSHEHEISLISAFAALTNIDKEKYEVCTLIIDKEGSFFYTEQIGELKNEGWKAFSDLAPAFIPQGENGGIFVKQQNEFVLKPVDVFFPVLHGENGEDGVIQGVFKMSKTPYVGSGVLSSATCMDKELTHIRLDSAGVKTAPYLAVKKGIDLNIADEQIKNSFGYPVFVKPANAGSSIGVGKARNIEELCSVLIDAFMVDGKVLIEKCIVGSEVECSVLGNQEPYTADFIGQVAAPDGFYDFDSKYVDDSTALYIPAKIKESEAEEIKKTALKAYKAMGCSGLARVDFFVTENEIILNEINNLPGFTSISMYPKLFEASGVSFTELIDRLIETAEVK